MGSYVPKIRYETTYDDDKVVLVMRPLSRAAFVKLIPTLQEAENTPDKGMALFDACAEVMESHLESVEGLRDANGNAVNKESVVNQAYFSALAIEGTVHLLKEANVGKLRSLGSVLPSQENSEGEH